MAKNPLELKREIVNDDFKRIDDILTMFNGQSKKFTNEYLRGEGFDIPEEYDSDEWNYALDKNNRQAHLFKWIEANGKEPAYPVMFEIKRRPNTPIENEILNKIDKRGK